MRLRKPSKRLKAELEANKRRKWAASRSKQQNGLCYWCAKPFVEKEDARQMQVTADHLVPLSRGGEDHYENIVAAHKRCNHAKANMLPEEFSVPGRYVWRPSEEGK